MVYLQCVRQRGAVSVSGAGLTRGLQSETDQRAQGKADQNSADQVGQG